MSLKSKNNIKLASVLLVNVIIYYAVLNYDKITSFNFQDMPSELKAIGPIVFGPVIVGLLNSQLPSIAKARMVFLRWNNPLPGSRAFSDLAKKDHRISFDDLSNRFRPLPTTPEAENVLWYKIYKIHQNDESVVEAHQSFLFHRDYYSLACILFVYFVVASLILAGNKPAALFMSMIIGLQIFLSFRAARMDGVRFVTNVLACAQASHKSYIE